MVADIVLFMTDGSSTTSISGGDFLGDALDESCAIKAQWTHLFALGIGTNIDENNLQAISGSIKDDGPANLTLTTLSADWANADFSQIEDCFQDIVNDGCTNELSIDKTVSPG